MILMESDFYFFQPPELACRTLYQANPFVEAQPVAAYIADHTQPDETIAVIGFEAEIYFYARRRAATGYIFAYGLTEVHPFALQMQKEMASEIERLRPAYIVYVNYPATWSLRTESNLWIFDWFAQYSSGYQIVAVITPDKSDALWKWSEPKEGTPLPRTECMAVLKRK